MTTYCAPCLADLALVREATTAVAGTSSCMAHAVLLTHPGDDPQRRRQRLAQLRDSANEKLETAGPEERLRLEILVEEYGLASAMESLVPRRRPDDAGAPTSRSARKRRGREGRERPGHGGQHGGGPGGGPHGVGQAGGAQPAPQHDEPAAGAGAPSGAVADGTAEQQGADALAQVGALAGEPAPAPSAPSAPEAPSPSPSPAPAPAPEAEPGAPAPSPSGGASEPSGGQAASEAPPSAPSAEPSSSPAAPQAPSAAGATSQPAPDSAGSAPGAPSPVERPASDEPTR